MHTHFTHKCSLNIHFIVYLGRTHLFGSQHVRTDIEMIEFIPFNSYA
jgi:hypothetical protein